MQLVNTSDFRKQLVAGVEESIKTALYKDRELMMGILGEAGFKLHFLPPFHDEAEPHALAIGFEGLLDKALRDNAADAEDSFAAASITGKSESITIKDGAKMVVKLDSNASIGDIADIHNNQRVRVTSEQGTLFREEAEAEQPDDGQMELDEQPQDEQPQDEQEPAGSDNGDAAQSTDPADTSEAEEMSEAEAVGHPANA